MGHTHYNELANDGRRIFAATRSTGQLEEGPVGYSIIAIDHRVVSWRFRKLGDPLPIVLITAPSDRRLATEDGHMAKGDCEVRASVLGRERIVHCTCSVDGRHVGPMHPKGANRYTLTIALPDGARTITVEAQDRSGSVCRETIELATAADLVAKRQADGSDADSIGAWVERGIHGTQLGPNRNGRHW